MEIIESLIDLIFLAFTSMVPLLLGAIGEIINERSGVVNIGIEGIFLLSALTSTIVNYLTNNLELALLTGVVTGMAIGFLHGLISTYLRGDQIVAGVGLNVFAYGMSVIALVTIWGTFGNSPSVPTIPKLKVLGHAISPLVPISIIIELV